jgi:VWFA-related protein
MTLARCLVTATVILLVLAAPRAQERPADAQAEQPVFRARVDLVRVDVSVTGRDDEAISTLQASDFIVTEDGVPQTIESAQFVRLDGQHEAGGRDLTIRDREHGLTEASRDDVRLFAIFFDDYHLSSHPRITTRLREALEAFVDSLQPTDLVVWMDPLTTLDGLTFTRDKWWLRDRIRTLKGRRGELTPVRSVVEEAQLKQGNVWELRAGVSLSAMEALVTHLGGLREGRKSVLFVSQGPPVGIRGSHVYPRLEAVVRAANRANVTVHAFDPRPLGSSPIGGAEALARLSLDTGGRAIVNTNAPTGRLPQVIADASAYYLLGYSPSRPADGKFHRIEVRVRQRGARVTARRGYWAAAPAELSPSPAPEPDPERREALETLAEMGRGRPVEVWIGHTPSADGRTEVQLAWEGAPDARDIAGAMLDVEPLARATGAAVAPSQTVAASSAGGAGSLARLVVEPGPVSLRMTLKDATGSLIDRWTDVVTVPDLADSGLELGTPRVYRTRSLLEARRFDQGGNQPPTVARRFRHTDRLVIDVPWAAPTLPQIGARLTNRDGSAMATLAVTAADGHTARVVLPLVNLAPGTYLVRIDAEADDAQASEQVAFIVEG